MRLVATRRVEEGAKLGRDVPSSRPDGVPLLRKGAAFTGRYRDALLRAGVNAVWIDDELSAGIAAHPAVSDETRREATQAVSKAFDGARDALAAGKTLPAQAFDDLSRIAALIAADVEATGEVALALTDLSSADSYTLQHSVDVCALGLLIGQRLFRQRGWTDYRGQQTAGRVDQRLTLLGVGLLVHDIGKLAIPAEVLNKPGRLDAHQWELMRQHPRLGLEMLKSDLISPLVKAVVREHHERFDGSGYPDGKSGEDIHEFARIAAVADVFDAVTSERPYAAAKPPNFGVGIIIEGSGTEFTPDVVEAFSKLVAPFPPGLEVELTDGRRGIVARVPPEAVERPVVRVAWDAAGQRIEPFEIELANTPGLDLRAVPSPVRA